MRKSLPPASDNAAEGETPESTDNERGRSEALRVEFRVSWEARFFSGLDRVETGLLGRDDLDSSLSIICSSSIFSVISASSLSFKL